MLLRIWTDEDHMKMLAVGQFAMIASLIILWTGYYLHTNGRVPQVLMEIAGNRFWEGFCIGLGIALALLSIFMNIRGMIGLKRTADRNP